MGLWPRKSKFGPEDCTFTTILKEFPEIVVPKKIHNKQKRVLSPQGNKTSWLNILTAMDHKYSRYWQYHEQNFSNYAYYFYVIKDKV